MAVTRSKGTITLLTQLTKVVHRRSTEELMGMRLKHFVALSSLYDESEVPQQQLCEGLMMDANNCVLLLNELEALGFVQRRRDLSDRRRHIVALTVAGRAAFERGVTAREAVEDDVLHALDAEERQTLRDLLAKALAG